MTGLAGTHPAATHGCKQCADGSGGTPKPQPTELRGGGEAAQSPLLLPGSSDTTPAGLGLRLGLFGMIFSKIV